ncbi:MAG: arylsulfatase [Puniceicoccaceae bacterium]
MTTLRSLLLACLIPALAGAADRPNVVFILSDDVGIGDINFSYPASQVETPNIDRLAAQSMRLTQAYAPGSVCSPTRYALISGEFPCRGPLKDQNARYLSPLAIHPDSMTLPRMFKEAGYRTAMIGKWHLGYGEKGITNWAGPIRPGPNELGFDYHLSLPTNHSDHFKTYVENHGLIWLKDEVTDLPGFPEVSDLTQLRYHDEVDTTLTRQAIRFIEAHQDEPFFVYLGLTAVHTHVTPHKDFRGKSEIGQLGDYIMELDHHVGEVVTALDRLGLSDDTILVFTSDNGGQENDVSNAGTNLFLRDESGEVAAKASDAKTVARTQFGHKSNGDLRGYKGDNYEGGFRIPFTIRWPGKIEAGSESAQVMTLADMLATFSGLIGQALPESAAPDSYDLSHTLFGYQLAPVKRSIILQTGSNQLAFREGDWKLVSTVPTEWLGNVAHLPLEAMELYHLTEDPSETTNLATEHPEKAAALHAELLRLIREGRSI